MELEIAAAKPPRLSEREALAEQKKREIAAYRESAITIDEHNRREVEEYAIYLGMDPAKDGELLWIADLALSAPLPKDWTEHTDAKGNIFFYNGKTKTSTYEHPLDRTFRQYYSKLRRRHPLNAAKSR